MFLASGIIRRNLVLSIRNPTQKWVLNISKKGYNFDNLNKYQIRLFHSGGIVQKYSYKQEHNDIDEIDEDQSNNIKGEDNSYINSIKCEDLAKYDEIYDEQYERMLDGLNLDYDDYDDDEYGGPNGIPFSDEFTDGSYSKGYGSRKRKGSRSEIPDYEDDFINRVNPNSKTLKILGKDSFKYIDPMTGYIDAKKIPPNTISYDSHHPSSIGPPERLTYKEYLQSVRTCPPDADFVDDFEEYGGSNPNSLGDWDEDEIEHDGDEDDEDICFNDALALKQLPRGRDVVRDLWRLDYNDDEDDLLYSWPVSFDQKSNEIVKLSFDEIDTDLKWSWEDDYFQVILEGRENRPDVFPGGDWANNRLPLGFPPRVKIYYANILHLRLLGMYDAAHECYRRMLEDRLVHHFFIPPGVYREMQLVYHSFHRYRSSLRMFKEVVTRSFAKARDISAAMECCIALRNPTEALIIWDSAKMNPNFQYDELYYNTLIKVHTMNHNIAEVQNIYNAALTRIGDPGINISKSNLDALLLSTYGKVGWQKEYMEVLEKVDLAQLDPEDLEMAFVAASSFCNWPELINLYEKFLQAGLVSTSGVLEVLLKAHFKLGNIEEVKDLLIEYEEVHGVISADIFSLVIRHKHLLTEEEWYDEFEAKAKSLGALLHTHRHYRTIYGALIYVAKTTDEVNELMDILKTKNIILDCQLAMDYALALKKTGSDWYPGLELLGKLASEGITLPTIDGIIEIINLCPHDDPTLTHYFWKMIKELYLCPTYVLTNAFAKQLVPNRNTFGRMFMRTEWIHWTSRPDSTRALDNVEFARFEKFLQNIYSTCPQQKFNDIYHPLYGWCYKPTPEPVDPPITKLETPLYNIVESPILPKFFESPPRPEKKEKFGARVPKLDDLYDPDVVELLEERSNMMTETYSKLIDEMRTRPIG